MKHEYIAELTGFQKEEIKEMIEYKYGACVWERLEDGSIICFPTGKGKVHLKNINDLKNPCIMIQ